MQTLWLPYRPEWNGHSLYLNGRHFGFMRRFRHGVKLNDKFYRIT